MKMWSTNHSRAVIHTYNLPAVGPIRRLVADNTLCSINITGDIDTAVMRKVLQDEEWISGGEGMIILDIPDSLEGGAPKQKRRLSG